LSWSFSFDVSLGAGIRFAWLVVADCVGCLLIFSQPVGVGVGVLSSHSLLLLLFFLIKK
jgi:hypothetical protein